MLENIHPLTALFEHLHREFMAYLAYKGVPEPDREDLIHETMILAIKQWRREPPMKPDVWLFHALKNVRKNYLRSLSAKKRKGQTTVLDEALEIATPTPNPHQHLMAAESVRRFLVCLGKLPPTLQQLLAFKSLQQLTIEELAKLMDTKEGTIKSRTHSARKMIEACLQEDATRAECAVAEAEIWEQRLQDALAYFAHSQLASEPAHLTAHQLCALASATSGEIKTKLLAHLAYCEKCMAHYRRLQSTLDAHPEPQSRRWDWRAMALGVAAGLLLGLLLLPRFHTSGRSYASPLRVELTSELVRGRTRIVLDPQRDALDLNIPLRLERPYPAYRLALMQDERQLFTQVTQTFEAGAVSLILPRHLVPQGEWVLRVYGQEDASETLLAQFELSTAP